MSLSVRQIQFLLLQSGESLKLTPLGRLLELISVAGLDNGHLHWIFSSPSTSRTQHY
jgi:hypothetical protein